MALLALETGFRFEVPCHQYMGHRHTAARGAHVGPTMVVSRMIRLYRESQCYHWSQRSKQPSSVPWQSVTTLAMSCRQRVLSKSFNR